MSAKIPVNVLTGFLGSGKTTLLNELLRAPGFESCAVLINEFGEVGLDHHLVERLEGDVVLLRSGCVCCTIRGDVASAIRGLLAGRDNGSLPPFGRIVIETSGLSDPVPVLATVMHDPVLQHHLRPGHVLTTFDAMHGVEQLRRHVEARRQLGLADRVVLTKLDLFGEQAALQESRLAAEIAEVNPAAEVLGSRPDAGTAADRLLGSDAFDPVKKTEEAQRWLAAAARRRYFPVHKGRAESRHGDIASFVVTLAEDVDWTVFCVWLSLLVHRHGDRILRVKGLLRVRGATWPVALHVVQRLIHAPQHVQLDAGVLPASQLVFIVQGLDQDQVCASWTRFSSAIGGTSKTGEGA